MTTCALIFELNDAFLPFAYNFKRSLPDPFVDIPFISSEKKYRMGHHEILNNCFDWIKMPVTIEHERNQSDKKNT